MVKTAEERRVTRARCKWNNIQKVKMMFAMQNYLFDDSGRYDDWTHEDITRHIYSKYAIYKDTRKKKLDNYDLYCQTLVDTDPICI